MTFGDFIGSYCSTKEWWIAFFDLYLQISTKKLKKMIANYSGGPR